MWLGELVDDYLEKYISCLRSPLPHTNTSNYKIELIALGLFVVVIFNGLLQTIELTQEAKINLLISKINTIAQSWQNFSSHFNAIPGDFPYATVHISSKLKNGNDNGLIDTPSEQEQAWKHLFSSGAIPKDTGIKHTEFMKNTFGQQMIFKTSSHPNNSQGLNVLFLGDNVPLPILVKIDKKVDDGDLSSGNIKLTLSSEPQAQGQNQSCLEAAKAHQLSFDTTCSPELSLRDLN